MTKLAQIKEEIESLPERDFAKLRKWMADKDFKKWDREIERDSRAGKLDFLASETEAETSAGKLKDL